MIINIEFLKSILVCPETQSALKDSNEEFLFFGDYKYPIIRDIPVMVKDPETHLMGHYNDVTNYIDKKMKKNTDLLDYANRSLREQNKKRLASKIEGTQKHLEDVQELLNNSIVDFYSKNYTPKEVVDDNESLIYDDFVLRYFPNILRDWFLDTGENEVYAKELKELGPLEGKCLVLGSGVSRLAYDLAAQNPNLEVVASDLNYVFLHIAQRINSGEVLKLNHMPLYPVSTDKVCVELESKPVKPLKNLHFVNSDFRNNQFQSMSFDTILAPWFFDVVDVPLDLSFKRVNYLLKSEGKMIYWGPYSFQEYGEHLSFAPEEITEIAGEMGFKTTETRIDEFPYLQDPYNAQSRMEKLFWGVFEKKKHLKFEEIRKSYKKIPSWVHDHSEAIPLSEQVKHRKEVYSIFNELYLEIDGEKNLKTLAKIFGKKVGLEPAQAKAMVELHFERVFKF